MAADKYSNCTLITSHNEPLRPGIELIKVAQAFDSIAEGSTEYITDEGNDESNGTYATEDLANGEIDTGVS